MRAKEKPTPRMHCPDCGGDDLAISTVDRTDRSLVESVECEHCGKSWIERYTLVLEEIEDE